MAICPPLSERQPLHPLYVPAIFALTIVPFIFPNPQHGKLLTFPVILGLFVAFPFFTAGSASTDYNMAAMIFAQMSNYLESVLFTPNAEEMRYFGKRDDKKRNNSGIGLRDCSTTWEEFKWALRLQTTPRGIGWNWQVKNVPPPTDNHLSRWAFVRTRMASCLWWVMLNFLSVYLMGSALALKDSPWAESGFQRRLVAAAFGWFTACGAYQGLQYIYALASALTVAVGVSEQWEWPPMFGGLKEAWSVRQMWSLVWHQLIRRMNQQPSIRLARSMGLRRGSWQSKYFQLYFGFFMSALLHEWNIYNAVREDGGTIWFFMIQAVAITFEDAVKWFWQRTVSASMAQQLSPLVKVLGWTWTFLWFSYCLPVLATSVLEAVVPEGAPSWTMGLGRQHTADLLR